MNKWNLVVDVAKCENCNNCTLAVKDEYEGNDFPGYSKSQPRHGHAWIKIERQVRGAAHMVDAAYLPSMCNHCDNAPCVAKSQGAIRQRPDGIVLIDPVLAHQRRDLVEACPYGHIWWNEEHQLPQAWYFDAHLLDGGWVEPRCVQVCPSGALQSHKISDAAMQQMVEQQGLEVLRPELQTKPRVYYKNLHRFNKCFFGGSVVAEINGRIECVSGATVTLWQGERELAQQQSDIFGDFKFDGLAPASGSYLVSISHPELGRASASATLGESFYLGEILIARSADPL